VAQPRIAVTPAGSREYLREAVIAGGGALAEPSDADALVWTTPDDADGLAALLDANPGIAWVQLPFAGIEPLVDVVHAHPERAWTSGKGVYAEPVAEMALALLLAGMRNLGPYAAATAWTGPAGRNLTGAKVAVLGGGGITEALLPMLAPFGADVTVVRRTPDPLPGATRVLGPERTDTALTGADAVVLALALTPDTIGVLDARTLALLAPGAAVVNVARGGHIVTDDLVAALRSGQVGSAGLDVTDPEPLPEGHPLWALPNVIITPHVGNTPEMAVPLLSARLTDNVRRWAAGQALIGVVDPDAGY